MGPDFSEEKQVVFSTEENGLAVISTVIHVKNMVFNKFHGLVYV